VSEKKRIASAVASIIEDGETVIINSGTTTFYIACELKSRRNLNIVTNSVSIAMELGQQPNINIILLGGSINTQYSFTYGDDTISQLKRYKADKLILSIDGISAGAGLTTYHFQESEVNKVMIERANNTIAAADYSKIGRESFLHVAPVDMIDYLVTNDSANRQELDKIEAKGVEIKLA
jgi:DeoR/GlpR family transcriptional regulator of sugar metabolism